MYIKKLLLGVLALLFTFATTSALAGSDWIPLAGPASPEKPMANVLISNDHETVISFTITGFWSEDVVEGDETFQALELPGYFTTLEIGKPQLPAIVELIGIPADANVTVSIVDYQEQVLPGYKVYPFQSPLLEHEKPLTFDYDESFYGQDQLYPSVAAEVGNPAIWRDLRVVKLTVYPLRYNPATGDLRVHTKITVKLEYTGTSQINVLPPTARPIPASYDNMYRKAVLNYDFLGLPVEQDGSTQNMFDGSYDYLIIAVDAYVDSMAPLVNWKNSQGLVTQVTPLSGVGSTVSAIKDYITQEYNNNGISYTLLVGNEEQIPGYTGWGFFSDYYYTLIAGNDDYADIALGRFCVHSPADVHTMVYKSVGYEKNPPPGGWIDSVLLVAHLQDAPGKYQGCKEEIRTTSYSWVTPNFSTAYGASFANGGDEASNADVITAIDAGKRIVNYRGHGDVGEWWQWNVHNESFTNSDVALLNNGDYTPVVFSIACLNCDLLSTTCLGEAFTLDTEAAAAFLGASNPSYTIANHTYDKRLFTAIFDDTVNLVGDASNLAATKIINEHGSSGLTNARMYLWLGDPTLQVVVEPGGPVAEFDATPKSGCVPLNVAFTDLSTGDSLISWDWDFGDGGTSTEQHPTHTYTTAGSFTVSLTVTDNAGLSDTEIKTDFIEVYGVPVADFSGAPTQGPAPLTVTFTNLSDFYGSATWDWNFGDGQHSYVQDPPPHTYVDTGYYTVSLTVTDDCGTDSEMKVDYVHAYEEQRVRDFAYNDISVHGGYVGGYEKTHATDDDYEKVYEEVVGRGGNATSRAEHKWNIDVSGNPPIEFCVEAYHTPNNENDHFDFYYSTYDGGYSLMLRVTKTTDDNNLQCYSLPDGVAGKTVWIRVIDTDRSKKNTQIDTLFVDYLYIESEAGPQVPDVVYNSHTVDYGGNGVLDPGETADLIVTLKNVGGADANNVAAILSTNDIYITINDNSGTYGNILAGGTADNAADPYNVTAAPDTPMGHVVEFYLDITCDGGYTNADTFYLSVGQQAMHVGNIDMLLELTKTAGPNKFYQAKGTVTVVDAGQSPVEGAWVYGQWSRQTTESDSGLTDVNGQVALQSDEVKNPTDWFKFCVIDVQKDGWVYYPNANVETCDSIKVGEGAKLTADIPLTFFSQNYPNPFNPETEIRYTIPVDCQVNLEVYNLVGQKVATLVDGEQKAGYRIAKWDASPFASGIYFYRIQAGDFVQTTKMVLLK